MPCSQGLQKQEILGMDPPDVWVISQCFLGFEMECIFLRLKALPVFLMLFHGQIDS